MALVLLIITVVSVAMFTEQNKRPATGLVTYEQPENVKVDYLSLKEFADFQSLKTLPAGNYYIGEKAVIYESDGENEVPIGRLKSYSPVFIGTYFVVDEEGNIARTS